ncbi:class I SAM-dependent methyltransferase [Alteromonadaceae bacterium M269]|nr:class I SAM-dependent methyltransferase [Alteromonadaceae bacterium M269]
MGWFLSKNEKWSAYWKAEGASGEVFVNKDGEKHEELVNFWRSRLNGIAKGSKIIDIACGAGSIFSDLDSVDGLELHAADISNTALEQLKERIPQVNTLCCSADDLPYESQSFDVVVSQFGVEYAGIEAFKEAARIVRPKGKLITVSHIADGYIDSRNKYQLDGAKVAKDLSFIEKSLAVVHAMYSSNQVDLSRAGEDFKAVEPHLAAYMKVTDFGVHAHLYRGVREMLSNMKSYRHEDIIYWLEGMQQELDDAILRLTEMRKAASTEKDMNTIKSALEEFGMFNIECLEMQFSDHKLPVGWVLSAEKS